MFVGHWRKHGDIIQMDKANCHLTFFRMTCPACWNIHEAFFNLKCMRVKHVKMMYHDLPKQSWLANNRSLRFLLKISLCRQRSRFICPCVALGTRPGLSLHSTYSGRHQQGRGQYFFSMGNSVKHSLDAWAWLHPWRTFDWSPALSFVSPEGLWFLGLSVLVCYPCLRARLEAVPS